MDKKAFILNGFSTNSERYLVLYFIGTEGKRWIKIEIRISRSGLIVGVVHFYSLTCYINKLVWVKFKHGSRAGNK